MAGLLLRASASASELVELPLLSSPASAEEAFAAADWVEAARRAQQLEEGKSLVTAMRDGTEPLSRADELRDTTLLSVAVEARRSRQSVCGEEPEDKRR